MSIDKSTGSATLLVTFVVTSNDFVTFKIAVTSDCYGAVTVKNW